MRTAFLLLVMAFTAHAQQDDTGVGIFTAFAGGVFGIGSRADGGVSLGLPTTRYLVPNVEFSYAKLGTYDYRTGIYNNTRNLQESAMYDLNGGVKIRFPGSSRSYVVPFLGLGVGLLRFSSDLASSGFSGNTDVRTGTNYLAGTVSGGVMYYITKHVGLQPEVKGYLSHRNFVRVTVGVFYQFP
jgi:outer membrane protein W